MRGRSRVTPPRMMKAWTPNRVVSPVASSFSNDPVWLRAMRRPLPTMRRKATRMAVVPSRPSSSPMTAKMKSFSASGMLLRPRPSPRPPMPPSAMANQPRRIWNPPGPSGSAHGLSHESMRCWTWAKRQKANSAPSGEEAEADREEAGLPGRDPQHHHEQGEEQQGRAEVLLGHDHDHGHAPGHDHGPEVLGVGEDRPALGPRGRASSSRFSTR